jgi:hypothetical protein
MQQGVLVGCEVASYSNYVLKGMSITEIKESTRDSYLE